MNKKVISFVLSSAMVFASVATAFAATGDVYNADGTPFATANEMNLSTAKKNTVNLQQSKYVYEYSGKQYVMKDAQDAYVAAGGNMDKFATEIAKKTPIGEVDSDIKSVTGLTDTVSTTGGEVLEFAINGSAQATKIADLEKAGYTVTFKSNTSVFQSTGMTSTDGVIAAALAADSSFEYIVIIKKADETGIPKEVARSAAKTVTVKNYANTVTEITSMEVVLASGIVVSSRKLAESDTATVKVMGRTKDMKANDKPIVITSKAAITSSDKTSATISTVGAVTVTAKTPTNVTFTAKAGDLAESITLNVGNEARVLSNKSIVSPTSVKLATGGAATVTVTTKDQYGDPFKVGSDDAVTFSAINATAAPTTKLATCTGSTEGTVSTDGKTASSVVTITAESTGINKELTGTAVLYDSANPANTATNKVAIGTVKVTVAPVDAVATWKLVNTSTAGIGNDFVLDLNATSKSAIHAEGYDKNSIPAGLLEITSGALTAKGWTLKSSDEKIATVETGAANTTVSAVKTGSTTIVLTDNLGKTVATLNVAVKNSAPIIQSATWKNVNAITDSTKTVVLKDVLTVTATEDGEAATVADFVTEDIQVDTTKIGEIVVLLDEAVNNTPTFAIATGTVTFTSSGEYKGTATIYVTDTNGNKVGSDVTINVEFTN